MSTFYKVCFNTDTTTNLSVEMLPPNALPFWLGCTVLTREGQWYASTDVFEMLSVAARWHNAPTLSVGRRRFYRVTEDLLVAALYQATYPSRNSRERLVKARRSVLLEWLMDRAL